MQTTRLLRVLPVLALALAACTATPQASSQATPSPVPSASAEGQTPYDGIWASKPLTRADLVAALAARGLSDARLDEWTPGWDEIDYRIFEIEIGNGRLLVHENAEGIDFGTQWAGDFEVVDADTIVAQDDEYQCPVTYDLRRDGDALSVRIAEDACSDPEDLGIQTVIYESSDFSLVQAADWTPPISTPEPAPSSAANETSTASTRQTPRPIGTVEGAQLGYLEYLPPGYGTRPSPLLVFLHGGGDGGAGDRDSLSSLTNAGIPELIATNRWPDERPFVVLSPQHEEREPSFCLEADEIDAFLRFALEHYEVDPSRVYLTGLSCGAIGLWNYLGAHGDELVAAAVPIAGNGIGAIQLGGCELGRLPIWAFHGSADDAVPVRGDVYPLIALSGCTDPAPVDARLKVYVGSGHDVWSETYRADRYDIYSWLLSHHR